jgi:glutamyl-tRNA synthetase
MFASEIFPHVKYTEQELEEKYPARNLPAGAMVTRICPSPTGFMHIGGVYAALISERMAHQTGGVFYLRVEDTDRKREVAGANELIVNSLKIFGLQPDEGEVEVGTEKGAYGPYRQSNRGDIYDVYVHRLLTQDLAYPCFCSIEDLDELRKRQEATKVRPGYYGEYAICRHRSESEVTELLSSGKPYIIRFKSPGDYSKRIVIEDAIRGKLEMPENDQDIVIRKTDGLPMYHLAHVVDDHLMRTTHVLRADEWVPSLPLHVQLFQALNWPLPIYGHISPIQKMDGSSRRKLSKRKDPEASVEFYYKEGYPVPAVVEYMLNLANSNFEDWRAANPEADYREFPLSLDRIGKSGALFDFAKLANIGQNIIGSYSPEETFEHGLAWAKQYDIELAEQMEQNKEYCLAIFNIERGEAKTRKDIAKWSDLRNSISYFFDPLFEKLTIDWAEAFKGVDPKDGEALVSRFLETYNPSDAKEAWFEKLKATAVSCGYSDNIKEFKKDPGTFKGHVGDIAKLFRIALTGKNQSPDLSEVCRVMGRERVTKRLNAIPANI